MCHLETHTDCSYRHIVWVHNKNTNALFVYNANEHIIWAHNAITHVIWVHNSNLHVEWGSHMNNHVKWSWGWHWYESVTQIHMCMSSQCKRTGFVSLQYKHRFYKLTLQTDLLNDMECQDIVWVYNNKYSCCVYPKHKHIHCMTLKLRYVVWASNTNGWDMWGHDNYGHVVTVCSINRQVVWVYTTQTGFMSLQYKQTCRRNPQ